MPRTRSSVAVTITPTVQLATEATASGITTSSATVERAQRAGVACRPRPASPARGGARRSLRSSSPPGCTRPPRASAPRPAPPVAAADPRSCRPKPLSRAAVSTFPDHPARRLRRPDPLGGREAAVGLEASTTSGGQAPPIAPGGITTLTAASPAEIAGNRRIARRGSGARRRSRQLPPARALDEHAVPGAGELPRAAPGATSAQPREDPVCVVPRPPELDQRRAGATVRTPGIAPAGRPAHPTGDRGCAVSEDLDRRVDRRWRGT